MQNPTPMMRQYRAVKAAHPDKIVLFRLGDFYEMFFEDAEVAARELELTLTSREAGKGRRVPMAGIPCHAADGYIARLLARGHKVAVCDQVEDPRQARGLVRREVTRVITPGTVLDGRMLAPDENNYLVAVAVRGGGPEPAREPRRFGLAAVDFSTGEFALTEVAGDGALREELARLRPAECLVAAGPAESGGSLDGWLREELGISPTTVPGRAFDLAAARERLEEHFGVRSLDGFGAAEVPLAVSAAGAALAYLQETQGPALGHLTRLRTYQVERALVLDRTTRRNLELTETLREGRRKGSLLGVLDTTATAMGGRLLRQWLGRPLLDVAAVTARLDAVDELVGDPFLRADLREALKQVYDLERLTGRAAAQTATARDLVALGQSLRAVQRLRAMLGEVRAPLLAELAAGLNHHPDLADLIGRALVDDPPLALTEGGLIRPGYHEEVDRLRAARQEGRDWILKLEARERERTGIRSLRVGFNKVFGYYLEVTRPNLHLVPPDYVRRQTLANAERFVTPELKAHEEAVLGADERLADLEYGLFGEVRVAVAARAAGLQQTASAVATLDVLAALAEVAVRRRYVRPEVVEEPVLEIKAGRHPVVEVMLGEGRFVPNDLYLDTQDHRCLIVTGPNMAGKSTLLRQAALITILAQLGSFVPAARAKVGLVDRVFTRVGASDDLAMGVSTFMLEMQEVAYILHHATSRSLVILDEVGRGTSTFDGMAIAWAVAEHLVAPGPDGRPRLGARTLFATHYHELTQLEEAYPGVRNVTVAVREEGDRVVFLHQLVPGKTDRSYGVHVARLAGLPPEVVSRAEEILAELEVSAEATRSRLGSVAEAPGQAGAGAGRRPEDGAGGREAPGVEAVGPRGRRAPRPRVITQFTLFETRPNPVLEELRRLDLDSLSPRDALAKLYELQARLRREGDG